MPSDRDIDRALDAAGTAGDVPAPGPALAAAVASMTPVRTRQPRRQLGWIAFASLAYGALLVASWPLRSDLGALPPVWVAAYASAWLAGFVALLALALLPGAGTLDPRWRAAAIVAATAGIAFPVGGLVFATHVPGQSVLAPETLEGFWRYSRWCLRWGIATALLPVVLCAIALRRAVPVRSRTVAAAIGAAGGALGGLMLHFHCPIADRLHVGFVHGGLVALSAGLAMLVLPRALRP
jgi:hypothetical protein